MLERQRIDVYPYNPGRLRTQLKLPPIADERRSTNQLAYLASYVRSLGCRSVLIERHYIDRDYMEDHGLFYARSLFPYANYCQRAHFLKTTAAVTKRRFLQVARAAAQSEDSFKEECDLLSSEAYLGFAVIKPLKGSPLGRTVLRSYQERTDDGRRRVFTCTRKYNLHVNGIELNVEGLPFQEQDLGVSACATTAIWCAVQKIQETESLPSATPAQITTLASRFALPFGRVLPADEGLSVDQMCQAVQALGVSPNLFRASDFATTRSYIYSALRSRLPPILILQHAEKQNSYHALTAVGMRLLTNRRPARGADGIDDAAADLEAVYVHDDRTGPYLRGNLVEKTDRSLGLNLLRHRDPDRIDPWDVTHVLVPTHPKIRLFLSSLRKLGLDLVGWIHKACELLFEEHDRDAYPVTFETWVTRAHGYMRHLYFEDGVALGNATRELAARTIFPRYVGVVRLRSPRLRTIDVLFDTTSTLTNLHSVAVVVPMPNRHTILGAGLVAQIVDAPLIY